MTRKIIFYNPHISVHFGSDIYWYLTRRKSPKKYRFILDYGIKNFPEEICFLIDKNSKIFKKITRNKLFFVNLEFFIWRIFNKIPRNIKILYDNSEISQKDILLGFTLPFFHYKGEDFEILKKTSAKKIIHLTHYGFSTSIISKNLEKVKFDYFIAENNLYKNSEYFRYFFPNYNKDVLVLPFAFSHRFKNKIKFSKRKNICLATGTLNRLNVKKPTDSDKDLINFFKGKNIHPMREEIYNNKEYMVDKIDSVMTYFEEKKAKKHSEKDSFFKKIHKIIWNMVYAKQTKYYGFDIVEKYNSYKMFIVPEEIVGLPGIGFVEGMACGSAFIGIDDPMYKDIGLIPGKDYIVYDGTLKDLEKKISYYQNNSKELENIAKSGYNFVRKNLNQQFIAKNFFKLIRKMS